MVRSCRAEGKEKSKGVAGMGSAGWKRGFQEQQLCSWPLERGEICARLKPNPKRRRDEQKPDMWRDQSGVRGHVIARHLQEIIDAWHKQFGD